MAQKTSLYAKWKDFCEHTSIHGLIYVFAMTYLARPTRLIWGTIWLALLALCTYQSILNVIEYRLYHVKVTTTYNGQQQISPGSKMQFPSITFTPISLVKRSEVGTNLLMQAIVASWFADSDNEFNFLMKQYKKSCYSNFSATAKITKWLEKNDADLNDLFSEGIEKLYDIIVLDFFSILQKCSWRNKDFNCSDAFIEHSGAVLSSFTFNMGSLSMVSLKGNKSELILGAYGLNKEHYSEGDYVIDTPNQGLKLLMNIYQNESCGNDKFKSGNGLIFQIHDVNTISSSLTDTMHYLSPGYHSNIAIRRVMYERNTEHLGRCSSTNDNLYMFPEVEGKNKQILCMSQCAAELILNTCHCYPPYGITYHNIFKQYAKRYNMSAQEIRGCSRPHEFRCLRNMSKIFISQCSPQCKVQCKEGKYEIQITKNFLPKSTVDRIVNGDIGKEEIRKSYISTHFYFSSMDVLLIEESQEFTLVDMFIYIGGNIGLFLGMSFISPFEVVDITVQLFYGLSKRLGREIKLRKTLKRNVRREQIRQHHTRKIQQIPMTRVKTIVIHSSNTVCDTRV